MALNDALAAPRPEPFDPGQPMLLNISSRQMYQAVAVVNVL